MVGLRAIDASDVLVTVGELGRMMAHEALNNGMAPDRVKMCATNDEPRPISIRSCSRATRS
jgi:hypothetical protein